MLRRMSSRPGTSLPATLEDPTPEPSSVTPAGSDDEVPTHLREDPFVRYMMDPPPEDIANLDALLEAGERYGEDHERALADLLTGRHPLQRSRSVAR
jgi:hypothetical protein